MNFLDRAISAVAPQRALQRVRSRVALELTQDYLDRHAQRFRYDGATAGRRAYGWYAASTDANVELMGSLIWLRNRSRDLVRNNPYAARAIEELAGNVVGTGIVPKAKTGSAAIDKIIDAEWPFSPMPATRRSGWTSMECKRWLCERWPRAAKRSYGFGRAWPPLICAFLCSFKCWKQIS